MCLVCVCVMLAAVYDKLCVLGVGVVVCYAHVFGVVSYSVSWFDTYPSLP